MKSVKRTKVESLKHKDKRTNIPTDELRDFVAEDERKPKTVTFPGLLYARDPSLDPQLVWKGKDEQDRQPLEVPAVPIYIQEKIHPHALIEDLRAEARKNGQGEPLPLFADFNGIKFEDLVDFYAHKDGVNWSNRMILGDSLLVMSSLAEKEGLKGKVQMIYMDPPYGIKFGSNWQVSTRKREVKDGKVEDANREPEVVRAFRDTWQFGIHSFLPYLRDRLVVARELLSESGSIFVQIGDENVHLVRSLMDEVFGSENFCIAIAFAKASAQSSTLLAGVNDFLLWYPKDINHVKYRQLFAERDPFENPSERYICVETPDEEVIDLSFAQKTGEVPLPEGRICRLWPLFSQTAGKSSTYAYEYHGHLFSAPGHYGWQTTKAGLDRLSECGRLHSVGKSLTWKVYHDEFPYRILNNTWLDLRPGGFGERRVYVVQTDPRVVARCLLMSTDPGDLVLDSTCGSGTTAYVAELWGRRWITIDTSRVALALARTRLMVAKFPYYWLADSPEGTQKEAEITGQVPDSAAKPENNIKKGFVCKRLPHITLKSIANNEKIGTIHARWQEKLDPIRAELNRTLKRKWEEWEIPREVGKDWAPKAKELHIEWWGLRRERQKEIDASTARHAHTEVLYDQPYEDSKRLRVSGPFTVESLSPHRVLSSAGEQPTSECETGSAPGTGQFETMILENLRKAGVQNTVRNERLKFERLEPYAGVWIHAAGNYIESGKTKRVAVSIGPEHGTVGPDLVKEAAKEAVQGVGFDLLLVCGFAFDPHVSEEAKRYGKLNVLTTRMNPDLSMGDELLKKTGAGNLFMIFGEPDIDIKKAKDGRLTAEIKGLDVYDPTTGQIRSHSTDDIACWFIDTNYNGESFFVRHAYFTGADEPYEKLKRALRAEIDEAAWSALYSTKSRPFDPPKTGKIAVKVINHYGDEVLKIYQV